MFYSTGTELKQILCGNIMLVICCIFYLSWWVLAFRPTDQIKGMKSGWLLIPAFIFGIGAIFLIALGSNLIVYQNELFPRKIMYIAGVIVYIILTIFTGKVLKRQVTTELILIVGWTVLMLMEINAIFALGYYTQLFSIIFAIIIVIAAIISLICYILYYNLDAVKGFVDGMIPIIIIVIVMIFIATIGAVINI